MPARTSLPVAVIGETLLWLAALLTLVTGYDYLRAGLRHIAPPSPRAASRQRSRLAASPGALA